MKECIVMNVLIVGLDFQAHMNVEFISRGAVERSLDLYVSMKIALFEQTGSPHIAGTSIVGIPIGRNLNVLIVRRRL